MPSAWSPCTCAAAGPVYPGEFGKIDAAVLACRITFSNVPYGHEICVDPPPNMYVLGFVLSLGLTLTPMTIGIFGETTDSSVSAPTATPPKAMPSRPLVAASLSPHVVPSASV